MAEYKLLKIKMCCRTGNLVSLCLMFSLSLASWEEMAVRVGNTMSLPGYA